MASSPLSSQPVDEVDLTPLAALMARAFPGSPPDPSLACDAMPGGASTRKYFRVRSGPRTAVAMYVPDGLKGEEVAKDAAGAKRWPFLEVREVLEARGVAVPEVYAEDTARGWVLLEDLGDDTLAAFLARHPERREELYARAVADVARAQTALAELPPGCIVGTRAFDADLLSWEIHHFREWALEARGITLATPDRVVFDGIAKRLATRIAGWPRRFVHRDYQSRNIMVRTNGSLCWIDFQDALLGPRVYDLVALLNDSYQKFDRRFVEARLDEYARASGLDEVGRAAIGKEFDLVTVQRKLKDAGRFVFIDRVKKNDSFLKFVEPTLSKVRASLERLGDDDDMRALSSLLGRVLSG
jgi:aminoglycoside/choline kinase family phosphotransferase